MLENIASRALLAFVKDPTEEKADAADNVVWRIAEAIIAKVEENLASELHSIRHAANARPTETTTGAVKRLVNERNGIAKKYIKAKDAWEDERADMDAVLDAVDILLRDNPDHIPCVRGSDSVCNRCALMFAYADWQSRAAGLLEREEVDES
jgi:hypothetical protein